MREWTKESLAKAYEENRGKGKIFDTGTGEFLDEWTLGDEDEAKIVYPYAIRLFEDRIGELDPRAAKIEYEKEWHDNPWGHNWKIKWWEPVRVLDDEGNELDLPQEKISDFFDRCYEEAKEETLDAWVREDEIEVDAYDKDEFLALALGSDEEEEG